MADIRIAWISSDGEEREETWPSLERFRAWMQAEGLHGTWRAYVEDEEGEWVLSDAGRL